MKKGQFAILIAVIVICAGCIFGYLHFSNNKDNKPEENNIVDKGISVVDAFDGDFTSINNWKVRLPKITGNTNSINNMNKEMLNYSMRGIVSIAVCHSSENECYPNGLNVEYKYKTVKDVLIITIFTNSYNDFGGVTLNMPSAFFYDIKNDKQLSALSAAKVLNENIYSIYNDSLLDKSTLSEESYVYLDYDNFKFYGCADCK